MDLIKIHYLHLKHLSMYFTALPMKDIVIAIFNVLQSLRSHIMAFYFRTLCSLVSF